MKHVMLFMPKDCAFDIIHRLGVTGIMQFDDLNTEVTAFQRTYANFIKKCEELERILKYFGDEIGSQEISLPAEPVVGEFVDKNSQQLSLGPGNSHYQEKISSMTTALGSKEKEVRELNAVYKQLVTEFNENRMLKYVLQEALKGHRQQIDPQAHMQKTETTTDYGEQIRFSRITGVVNSTDQTAFERMVFRFSRGSCFLRFADIYDGHEMSEQDAAGTPVLFVDPVTGKGVSKVVFTAVFVGSVLREKIETICQAFNATIVEVPDAESAGAMETQKRVSERKMHDIADLIKANRERTCSILSNLTGEYYQWMMQVKCMKGVFHTLNKCRSGNHNYVIAQGWLLANQMEYVQGLVREIAGDTKGGALSEKNHPSQCRRRISRPTSSPKFSRARWTSTAYHATRRSIRRFLPQSLSHSFSVSCSETWATARCSRCLHSISSLTRNISRNRNWAS